MIIGTIEHINEYKRFNYIEDILKRINTIKLEIEKLEIEKLEIEANYDGVGSVGYTEGRSTLTSSSVENEILRKEKKIEQINSLIFRKKIEIKKIYIAINNLKGLKKKVIEERFIKEKQWKVIAEELSITESRCFQIRIEAINEICNFL